METATIKLEVNVPKSDKEIKEEFNIAAHKLYLYVCNDI